MKKWILHHSRAGECASSILRCPACSCLVVWFGRMLWGDGWGTGLRGFGLRGSVWQTKKHDRAA